MAAQTEAHTRTREVALVTGASSGVGAAIAQRLAQDMTVVLAGRDTDRLQAVAAPLEGARIVQGDLASRDDVYRIARDSGDVAVLVANAGVRAGKLADLDLDDIDRIVEVNLTSVISLVRLLLPGMAQREWAHVVLMSSMTDRRIGQSSAVYAATKAGLRGFGTSLQDELLGSNVFVTIVFPTYVRDVGMWARSGGKRPRSAGEVPAGKVADAVVNAIRGRRLEISVAPRHARATAVLACTFPNVAARVRAARGR